MPRVIWTPPALADVQRIYRFLALQNPEAARRAVRAIRMGVKTLALQPQLGRPVEDLASDFREWLVDFGQSGYVAIYRLDDNAVAILAVRHQKEVGW